MKNNKEIVVLAYSGGLDTSFCVPYLAEKGFEVHAVFINTGGTFSHEINELEKRALDLGAEKFECIDVSDEYYNKCIKYLISGNVLRGNTYPLSVSSERVFQAKAILKYVQSAGAKYVAHGSTGAGNDQIRFDIFFQSMAPDVTIIAPIREHKFSRQQEVDFLAERGVKFAEEKKDYSINKGLWGTSVGGKETLTSNLALPQSAYPSAISDSNPQSLTLTFDKGEVTHLNGKPERPIVLIQELESIASKYGIGRDIHVGDTIIGIKGRVGFEAAAATIIIKAHELLEKHTLTKWQSHWKRQIGEWYGMMVHEGQYLDPTLRNMEDFLDSTQEHVSGDVMLTLYPRTFTLDGVQSDNDLMNSDFGSYGEENIAWTGSDVIGFTKILANPHQIYYSVHKHKEI